MTEEEKEAIKSLNEFAYTIHGTLSVKEAKTILNLVNRQQEDFELLKEQQQYVIEEYSETIEEKDKIINELVGTIAAIMTNAPVIKKQFKKKYCDLINSEEDCCWKTDKECKDCIKEYFERKKDNV